MDVGRTIEFILEQQAKTETRLDAISKLLQGGMDMLLRFQTTTNDRFNALLDAQLRAEARMDRLEGKMAELAEAQTRLDGKVAELADAQKVTELKLQAFIDSLRRGGNGNIPQPPAA